MIIRCANCNRILSEDEHTCPSCSSRKRRYSIKVGGVVELHSGLKIKQREPTGFVKVVSWVRNKISGKSKRHAREELRIDRSDTEFTQKLHHVEEATETGEYEVVHDEDQRFPAKRRPQH